jgi:type IV pilus assembly protein PilP
MRTLQAIFGACVVVMLTACGASRDYADIEDFMAEVDSRPKGRIEPLPPIETVRPFAYQASTKRSPFEPPVVFKKPERQSGPQVTPDFNRVKQFLEQFTIGQLAMVGTLAQGGTTFALIQDSEGGVHRVQPGDFMGTDHGKVEDVSETEIALIEIVPDGTGGWVERSRTVALADVEARG